MLKDADLKAKQGDAKLKGAYNLTNAAYSKIMESRVKYEEARRILKDHGTQTKQRKGKPEKMARISATPEDHLRSVERQVSNQSQRQLQWHQPRLPVNMLQRDNLSGRCQTNSDVGSLSRNSRSTSRH
jgi:hypothetical protein